MTVPPGAGPPTIVPPYHAQWATPELIDRFLAGELAAEHDPGWAATGARTPQEYEFWTWRGCGVACLQSVLDERLGASPGLVTLAHELLLAGGYTMRPGGVRGLIYAPFVKYLDQRWQISAESRPELPLAELATMLRDGRTRALVSVNSSIRDAPAPPPERGGHLVLAYASAGECIEFHNPSGHTAATRQRVRLPLDTFASYYAERGVVIPPAAEEWPTTTGEWPAGR